MKLERWALVAEIGSAIAVVISLVFVGLQVRLGAEETAVNTSAIRSAAFQELSAQIANLNVLMIENPELDSALTRVMDERQQPESQRQRRLVEAWLRLVYRHGEIAYKQYRDGLIDEAGLRSALGVVLNMFLSPAGREQWDFMTPILDEGYVAYVDELVDRLGSGPSD